jgi:Flp pilus assembly secretin CpaC
VSAAGAAADAGGAGVAGVNAAAGGASQTQGGFLESICPARGSISADRQSTRSSSSRSAIAIAELVAYAKSFDFKTQQVNIKAKIIAVDRTGTERLGVSYDIGTAGTFFNTLAPRLGPGGQQQGVPTEFQVALGGDAFAGIANASRTFSEGAALNLISTTTLGRFSISAFLDALSQEELSDIQAEPSVNTMDKRQAEIFVGNRVPYLLTPPTPPGQLIAVAPQLREAEVGIKLTVTPSISSNRTIRMVVAAEQSNLIAITAAGPNSAERRATTSGHRPRRRDGGAGRADADAGHAHPPRHPLPVPVAVHRAHLLGERERGAQAGPAHPDHAAHPRRRGAAASPRPLSRAPR